MDWKLEYYVTICRIQPGKFKKDKKAHEMGTIVHFYPSFYQI